MDPRKKATSPAIFAKNLNRLLESVYASLPKTFVNLMLLPEGLEPAINTSRWMSCKSFKRYSEYDYEGIQFRESSRIMGYNVIITETARAWSAKNLKDFGVSLQPFVQDAPLDSGGMDTLGCFHPNLASHQGMAVALWNNMVASSFKMKSKNWKQPQNVTCPSPTSRLSLHSVSQVVV